MRVLIASLWVALVSLVGASLTPVAAGSAGIAASQDVSVASPLAENATFGWRRRHYGYGWRGYYHRPYYYYRPRYYHHYYRPRYYRHHYYRPYYGYRHFGFGFGRRGFRHW